MVIFEGKYLNYEWWSTCMIMSERGWTDQELFLFWQKTFLIMPTLATPCYCSWMGTHPTCSIELAKEKDVVIFCLLPHTTHRSQPLDICVFGPVIIVLIAIHLFLYIMQYFWTPNNSNVNVSTVHSYTNIIVLHAKFNNKHDLVFTYAFHRINAKVAYYTCTIS